MLISGVQKFTILDYPGKIACMIFTPYCNFRCGYCHNSEDVLPERIEKIKHSFIPENTFFNFLKTRKNFIDGVVITGGEPTLQNDLKDFIFKIKNLGFLVKLDTNGTNPDIVKKLIEENLLDFIAMDIKSDFENYKNISNFIGEESDLLKKIKESIKIIIDSNIDYEFRTTIAKNFISKENILNIGKMIFGCKKYALQNFRKSETVLDQSFNDSINYGPQEISDFIDILKNDFNIKNIEVRN